MSDSKLPVVNTSESTTPTIHDEPGVTSPVDASGMNASPLDAPSREKSTKLSKDEDQGSESNSDVLIVNWEGPDDPQNPRKYVILIRPYPSLVHAHNIPAHQIRAFILTDTFS